MFINDFAAKTQYFFDLNNSVARKIGIGPDGPPRDETQAPGSTSEYLGTKTIEGVSVEGTRITFELPVGQIGNDKPIQGRDRELVFAGTAGDSDVAASRSAFRRTYFPAHQYQT